MLTTTNAYPDNSTDARFRAWGKAISDGLLAAGLSKTTDTGQINWATVVHPGSGVFSGYEIWKFTDALQSTVPVIFRIDYGDSSGRPCITVQCGDSTDGAGNLIGGQVGTVTTYDVSVASTTVQSQIAVAGSTNRVAVGFFITNRTTIGHTPRVFTIERDKDNTGADTSLGFYIVCATGSSRGTHFIPKASVGLPQSPVDNAALLHGHGTGAYGTTLGLVPVFPSLGAVLNPSANIFGSYAGDIPENTLIAFTLYSATHNFFTVDGDITSSLKPVMRYD